MNKPSLSIVLPIVFLGACAGALAYIVTTVSNKSTPPPPELYLRILCKEGIFYFAPVNIKQIRNVNYQLTGITNLIFSPKD